MAKWATKGWDNAEEQAKSTSSFTNEFFIKDGEEALVRVLDEEPLNIRDHFVNGKMWMTCLGEDCPLCLSGNKATNHFVFNILDKREWVDKAGTKHTHEVKIWRTGIRLLRLLNKKQSKYGPINTYDITLSRMGAGANTTYDIDVEHSSDKPEDYDIYERYDLFEVLQPKTKEELASIAGSSSKDNDDDDDEVPGGLPWSRK